MYNDHNVLKCNIVHLLFSHPPDKLNNEWDFHKILFQIKK